MPNRVLIVDDDQNMCELIHADLKSRGIPSDWKTSANDAISAVQMQLTDANVWVPLVSQPLWVVAGDRLEGVRAHGIYGAGLYKGLDIKLKR